MTGVGLCKRAGMCMSSVSTYELGIHLPKLENATKLARALNVRLEYLVGLTDRRHER